jgi:DNA invertase Pin-like site-specific DNA recombinase
MVIFGYARASTEEQNLDVFDLNRATSLVKT